jgi:hypothetical protein
MYLVDLNAHCSPASVEIAEPNSLQKESTNLAPAQMPADRVALPAAQLQLPAQMPAVQVADGAVPPKHFDILPSTLLYHLPSTLLFLLPSSFAVPPSDIADSSSKET